MNVFETALPDSFRSPLILSIPHCGSFIPEDIKNDLKSQLLPPDDTDWFVDQLYAFAQTEGIPVIRSLISRWVIDLNRDPDHTPLYDDGRMITGLCPVTDFLGNKIYRDERAFIPEEEIGRRKSLYFEPYHNQLEALLKRAKQQFGTVLLWDCHSIRRRIPTISPDPFPDLVLGTAEGQSASEMIISVARETLSSGKYQLSLDFPFKGGYITRRYGNPAEQQHALQLEMSKDIYMDPTEKYYDSPKAEPIQDVLRSTIQKLETLLSGNEQ